MPSSVKQMLAEVNAAVPLGFKELADAGLETELA